MSEPAKRDENGSKRRIGARWTRGVLALCTIGVIVAIATFISGAGTDEGSEVLLTHTILRGELAVTVTEQGTLESSENVEVKCRVRGWSKVIWVVEGGTVVEPGDVLVRLDTKRIDDAISLHKTDSHTARATLERTKADVAQAEIAEKAYLEGRYKSQRQSFEREVKIAERNLRTAREMLAHSKTMFSRGYINELEVEGNSFTVRQAELERDVKATQLDVLERYTKAMELETIRGNYKASHAKLKADISGLAMDEGRRDRAIAELEHCVVKAERGGMVIYPSAAAWKDTPDVTEGANVRKDQVLLLMPDLSKMQVKVGIHESMIDRMSIGLAARITMSDMTLDGSVRKVASIAQPAGWWTGNVVKYETIIEIPETQGLKPGMSAQVEVVLAEYEDVLTIPVAAVVETEDEELCWVKTADGPERRPLVLGDGNDVFIVVEDGLQEGDEVILNPRAVVDEAKDVVLKTVDESEYVGATSSTIDSETRATGGEK